MERFSAGAGAMALAAIGALVALALVLMKLLPFVPGHMSWPQYLGLAVWMALGIGLVEGRGRTRIPALD